MFHYGFFPDSKTALNYLSGRTEQDYLNYLLLNTDIRRAHRATDLISYREARMPYESFFDSVLDPGKTGTVTEVHALVAATSLAHKRLGGMRRSQFLALFN